MQDLRKSLPDILRHHLLTRALKPCSHTYVHTICLGSLTHLAAELVITNAPHVGGGVRDLGAMSCRSMIGHVDGFEKGK
jgi:hypothetical protein